MPIAYCEKKKDIFPILLPHTIDEVAKGLNVEIKVALYTKAVKELKKMLLSVQRKSARENSRVYEYKAVIPKLIKKYTKKIDKLLIPVNVKNK